MPTATLHVAAGPAAGSIIPLEAEPLEIGRETGPDSAGALGGDPELSRKHARISIEGGVLTIEDLASSNGTFVNDARIQEPTVLRSGDRIKVGTTTLTVEQEDPQRTAVRPAASDLTAVRPITPDVTAVRRSPDMTAVRATRQPEGSGEPPRKDPERGLLGKIANLSSHSPGRMLGGVVVLLIIAIVFGAPVAGMLHANDQFNDPGSQSVKVKNLIARATGQLPGVQIVALVTPPGGASGPSAQSTVEHVASQIQSDPVVTQPVLTFYNTHSPAFVSTDKRALIVVANFKNVSDSTADDAASRIIDKVSKPPLVLVGGPAAAGHQLGSQVGKDLGMSEGIAFPILFILSLFVFRGVVAALMPLFVGGLTVMGTFLVLRIINSFLSLSQFALNVVIGLGLGLAIDYSLFVVSRYREELAKTPPEERTKETYHDALHRAMYTAGRTILFSSITVALALASLCVIPLPFLYSMGLGGAVCALVAVTVSLVALPALLALLGPRINSLAPARWQRSAERVASQEFKGNWYRLTQFVMRRPVVVAIVSAAVLVGLGIPAWGIKFVGVDAGAVPSDLSARQVDTAVQGRFISNGSAAITAVVKAPPSAAPQVDALATQLRSLPGATPTGEAPHPLGNGYFAIQVIPKDRPTSTATINLVKAIRAHQNPQLQVTGSTASFLDQKASISSKLWLIAVILCVLTTVVLFLMTGSVVLPIKSLIMNALSLSAAFGIVVFIFQDGHLQGLLDFTSLKAIDISQPILIAAIGFGLASDYAVFLLTRIKEAHDSGLSNAESVAIGLERTGRIVTQAAFLFCIAIGAFSLSAVVFIKEVGVGTAAAVIIDATIIRALLVPALMALLGEWNWWAPGPLRRLHAKIGLSEG